MCLIQEQLSKNRIILELDPKGNFSASVTSSTHERKSRTVIALRGGRIQMQHNTVGDDVPIVVVLKAMGLTSDLEICSLIGPEPELLVSGGHGDARVCRGVHLPAAAAVISARACACSCAHHRHSPV